LEEMGLEEKQQVFIAFEASAVNIFEAFENTHSSTATLCPPKEVTVSTRNKAPYCLAN
ncbi:unnamed protein product, partial [marine sediment metagenome]